MVLDLLWFLSDPGVAEEGSEVKLEVEVENLLSGEWGQGRLIFRRLDLDREVDRVAFAVPPGDSVIVPRDFEGVPDVTFTMPSHDVDLEAMLQEWDGSIWRTVEIKHHTTALQPSGAEFEIDRFDAGFGELRTRDQRLLVAEAEVQNTGDERGRACVEFTATDQVTTPVCGFISPGDSERLRTEWSVEPGTYRVCGGLT